jgi:hypothetical protein
MPSFNDLIVALAGSSFDKFLGLMRLAGADAKARLDDAPTQLAEPLNELLLSALLDDRIGAGRLDRGPVPPPPRLPAAQPTPVGSVCSDRGSNRLPGQPAGARLALEPARISGSVYHERTVSGSSAR